MESSSMATRLRRPFAYDSDNSLPEALDEQGTHSLLPPCSPHSRVSHTSSSSYTPHTANTHQNQKP